MKPNSITARGLENHINAHREEQNGNGYKEFVYYMELPKQLTYSALGTIFNKDGQTIAKWADRYRQDKKASA